MDFASNERALTSLQRRQPSLSPPTLEAAEKLLDHVSKSSIDNPASFIKHTTTLLQIGSNGDRWEPLAVGLHLTSFYLEKLSSSYVKEHASGEGGDGNVVFMDGPRVPSISDNSQESSNLPMKIEDEALESFSETVTSMCHLHLEHNEPRVRTLLAKVVGEFTKLGKNLLLHYSSNTIMKKSICLYTSILKSLYDHLESGRDSENKSKSSTGALDDTTGWRYVKQ